MHFRPGDHALRVSAQSRPWLFLGLTLGITWAVWFTAAALDTLLPGWAVNGLHFLGGLAPLAVAASLAHWHHNRRFELDFWRRTVDFGRISPAWYAVIFLYTPVKSGLAALIDVLAGGWGMVPEAAARLAEQPLSIFPMLLFWLFFGPVAEEPGWRGYALDGLQAGRSALAASLIVGTAWALWHLPLFFIAGTWQAEYAALGTQRFWFFMLTIVVESVLYTWIYNHTNRSILAAILFHFTVNAIGELFELSPRAELFSFILSIAAVMLVVAVWGPLTLRGRSHTMRTGE